MLYVYNIYILIFILNSKLVKSDLDGDFKMWSLFYTQIVVFTLNLKEY